MVNDKEPVNVMLDPWIEIYSGKRLYFLKPDPSMIDIGDIAHHLSMQCRFHGGVKYFYSVAEHCMRVQQRIFADTRNVKLALAALLHDASEAYLSDIAGPFKKHLPDYKAIEEKVQGAIFEKFGLNPSVEDLDKIKGIDNACLKNEARFLLPSKGASWIGLYESPYEITDAPQCFNPDIAKAQYLAIFENLSSKIKNIANHKLLAFRHRLEVARAEGEVADA